MKLMFVASECVPFVKTGGLGEVIGALPVSLASKVDETIVVVPFYKVIKEKYMKDMECVGEVYFTMAWRKNSARVFTLEMNKVRYYFIENDQYFYRDNIYGDMDEVERFAFFDLACLELLKLIKYHPDVIHVHDWQAAMIPVLYKEKYCHLEGLENIKTVLTIHNPAFQGYCQKEALGNLFNLPQYLYDNGTVRFKDGISTLKAGMVYADALTTVSPTNAKELLSGTYAYGLEDVFRSRERDFYGILNGIDYKEYDPSKDKIACQKYTFDTYAEKAKNKAYLQEKMCMEKNPNKFLVGIASRLTFQKGIDLVLDSIPWMNDNNIQIAVVGGGEANLEKGLQECRDRYPNNVGVYLTFTSDMPHLVYSACDMILVPSLYEPCGLSQMIGQRYGTVPLVREVGGLKDSVISYNEYTKEGTGFSFANYSGEELRKTLYYASNIYFNKKEEWLNIVKQCMEKNNSWAKSSLEYLKVYNNLVK